LKNRVRPERHTLRFLPSILRSTFSSRAAARLLIAGLGLALLSVYAGRRAPEAQAATAPAACECNRNAPDVIHARWMPNSSLRVMFRRGDFSAEEVAAFHDSIRLWQAVLPSSGTGIDLQIGGEVAGNNCTSCIIVKRKADMQGTFAALTLLSTQGDLFQKAVINIKSDVHKTVLLRMLMTHELGHAFGLDDCPECAGNTTVMNSVNKYAFGKFSFLAPRSKMASAPTRCDIARVSAGYAGATTALARAALNVQPLKAQARVQPASVSTSPVTTVKPTVKPALTVVKPAAAAVASQMGSRQHASRAAAHSSFQIGQLAVMDSLTQHD
jgi:hypothetical protein